MNNKTESAIFVSLMCSLLPEDFYFECILLSLQQMLCRLAAVKPHPIQNSTAYIFRSFGINWLILGHLHKKVPLKPVQVAVGNVIPLNYCRRTDSVTPK